MGGLSGFSFPGLLHRDPAPWIAMDEQEYAEQLRGFGFGEHAIETELQELREYKETFAPAPEAPQDPYELAEHDERLRAVLRRKERQAEETKRSMVPDYAPEGSSDLDDPEEEV